MTFYTPLERLAKTAKEGGFQKVSADVDVVARLIEIARAADAWNRTWMVLECTPMGSFTPDLVPACEAASAALRAALGTQPVKETNHG